MAVVAAIAVGAYLVIGGSGGGSDVADDGAHKLTTPATVLSGEYEKSDDADSGGFDESDVKDAEKHGVKNAKDVHSGYQAGDAETNPLAVKAINFMGVYGDIDDPEAVVDGMFTEMKKSATEDDEGEAVGSPKVYTPSGLDGAILKCQEVKYKDSTSSTGSSSASAPSEISMPVCIWGDHSTLGVIIHVDLADAMSGKSPDLASAAELTVKFRKDVRVKI